MILFHLRAFRGRTLLAAGLYRTERAHKLVIWLGLRAYVLSFPRKPRPAFVEGA
jgi:hypothetical protein